MLPPKTRMKIEKEMIEKKEKSNKLYEKVVEKGEKAIDPVNWLYNQTILRYSWENFQWHFEKNELTEYLEFMYNEYPAGFGDAMKQGYKDGMFDGASTYYSLKNKNLSIGAL